MSTAETPFVDLDLERVVLGELIRFGLYPTFLSAGLSQDTER